VIWLVVSFLKPKKPKKKTGDFGGTIKAGPIASFALSSVTAFPRGHFYLARLEDGGFLALHRKCTHLGCTVPWVDTEKLFICPCHASTFDIRGSVLKAPATRALDLFKVTIENNIVFVDTGALIKRSGYRKEQVVYPENSGSKA
jgi:cytochrome b6-f complex iron-sulfur subunit